MLNNHSMLPPNTCIYLSVQRKFTVHSIKKISQRETCGHSCWCTTDSMSISKFVPPTCSSWNRVSSVSLFLSFDLMCFIVEKLLSQMLVLPNMLSIDSAKSLRRGKRNSGIFQNSSPLSVCLAWKKGSDWSLQSYSSILMGCGQY